jgi:SAM-dependent methyltransferase
LNSLRLAQGFKTRFSVNHTAFLQMNLFRPPFRPEVFDLVFSNGVLHHTGDPRKGFESISRLVKPGGYIVIGLYNHIGRLPTDFRRWLFRAFGDRLSFLDDHMRNATYNQARKRAWFMDQYRNPHESKHCYSEVLEWFERAGFDFRSAVPKIDGSLLTDQDHLFEKHPSGGRFGRFLTECQMLLGGGQDGAIFILAGQKTRSPAAVPFAAGKGHS